jgi:hypothetical protein
MRDAAYGILQDAWSAWLRRRLATDFAQVERFCLFAGYPRSGHSLVGALLNAHRDAVISHELDVPPLILGGRPRDEIYARIVARARWFHLRGDRSNYAYRVPGQWQGRFARLRVIGDKRGGAVTRSLAAHPELLERTRALVGVPLRVLHVVRNPFDNVAAIAIWEKTSLADAARFYFRHCETTARLPELCAPGELLALRHEDVVRDPAKALRALCDHLGLAPDPGWIASCSSIVFPAPTGTRHKVEWPADLRAETEVRARDFTHLAGYAFDSEPGGVMRTNVG